MKNTDSLRKLLRKYNRKKDQDENILFALGYFASIYGMLSIFSAKKKEWFSFGMLITTFISGIIALAKYSLHLNFINDQINEIKDWLNEEDDFFDYEDDWLDDENEDDEELIPDIPGKDIADPAFTPESKPWGML